MEELSSVYIITNKITGEVYVGSSSDPDKRFISHFQRYNNPEDKEYNKPLYIAMREYGEENFDFRVVEQCPHNMRFILENEYIERYHALTPGIGYNTGHNGEAHGNSILTESDVRDIRQRYLKGEDYNKVFESYSDRITKSGFSNIWIGDTWKRVMPEVYENRKRRKFNSSNELLDDDEVRQIRQYKKEGKSKEEIYELYKDKVPYSYFKNVWFGTTRPHIKV